MPKAAHRGKPVPLTYLDGQVRVTPEDQDIFFISAVAAVRACCEVVRQEERVFRFTEEVLLPLHRWCLERSDRVSACYLPQPTGNIKVFVVGTSRRFDFDLAEEVAALELRLARSGWRIGVVLLPASDEEALATFFNAEGALEVYAQRGPAPQEG
jgi:hypothetical protein